VRHELYANNFGGYEVEEKLYLGGGGGSGYAKKQLKTAGLERISSDASISDDELDKDLDGMAIAWRV
jgi:hypothetical protein